MFLKVKLNRDALFFDIDGTLLDIAPSAEDVVVPKELIEGLGLLHNRLGGALALISGRTIGDIDRLFNPFRFPCAGVHGAQYRMAMDGPVQNGTPLSKDFRHKCAGAFASMKGVVVEDKGWGIAVHYRHSLIQEDILVKILSEFINEDTEKDLLLFRGKKVVEVTRSSFNKGRALSYFLTFPPFEGKRPIFLGDDQTDLSAMGVSLSKGGVAVRVGKGSAKENAFCSPAKVRAWIDRMIAEGS